MRILYLNAFFIMSVKIWLLYRYTTETATGRVRMEQTRGVSIWRSLSEYRGVLGLIVRSKGTIFSLVIAAIVGAVALVNGTFWQVVINQRLGVPDALLPFFPMIRSLFSALFFFTLIPRLTHAKHLKAPTLIGFGVYLAGQLLLVGILPDGAAVASTYALLAVCLVLDAFGGGILFMLAESLVALHVDRHERLRVMAIQRTCVMLVTAPFGWISGWLSSMDRSWPFLLTSVLLILGVIVAGRFWVTTHEQAHDDAALPRRTRRGAPASPHFRGWSARPRARRLGEGPRPSGGPMSEITARTTPLLAAAAAAALLLPGCAPAQSPSTPPPAAPTTTAQSPAPSETPTRRPEESPSADDTPATEAPESTRRRARHRGRVGPHPRRRRRASTPTGAAWEVTVLREDGTGVELYVDAETGEITRERDTQARGVQATALKAFHRHGGHRQRARQHNRRDHRVRPRHRARRRRLGGAGPRRRRRPLRDLRRRHHGRGGEGRARHLSRRPCHF